MGNCIIIDNEPYAAKTLADHIGTFPAVMTVNIYSDPFLALKEIEAGGKVDIIVLNIEIPGLSGLELAPLIRDKATHLIFSTDCRQYAYEAFEAGADGYLLKPYTRAGILKVFTKLLKIPANASARHHFFFVKNSENRTLKKINFSDIYAVESLKNHVKIHLAESTVLTYISLSEIFKELEHTNYFIRVSRSFIIAQRQIESFSSNTLKLTNGREYIIGTNYRVTVNKLLGAKLLGAKR